MRILQKEHVEENIDRIPTANPKLERIKNTVLGSVYGSSWAYTNQFRPAGSYYQFPETLIISPLSEMAVSLNKSLSEVSTWNILKLLDPANPYQVEPNQDILRILFAKYLGFWLNDKQSTFDVPEDIFDIIDRFNAEQLSSNRGLEFALNSYTNPYGFRDWFPLWRMSHNHAVSATILQTQITQSDHAVIATTGLFTSLVWHNARNLGPDGHHAMDLFEWLIEQTYSFSVTFADFSGTKIQYGFNQIIEGLKEVSKFIQNKTNFAGLELFDDLPVFSYNQTVNAFLTAVAIYHLYNKLPTPEILVKTLDGTNNDIFITGLVGELLGSVGREFPKTWFDTLNGHSQDKLYHAWSNAYDYNFIQTKLTSHDETGRL